MLNKKKSFIDKIPNWGWLCISLATAILLWYFLSVNERTARVFPFIDKMVVAFKTVTEREILWADIKSSMISVLLGFLFGFLSSVPVAFLMAWYRPVRYILEPWIQFIRNIPPLAYVPLVVIAVGVGRVPQVIVIWIATFLTMTITIYQGVRNVDETLIKAARVLGAKDSDLFIKVIFPATTPFILTAVRLGSSVALTTLIAAESTGAFAGLGMRIRSFNNSYEVEPMLLYIILIGIIGITIEKIIKFLEKKLTGWQETREV
ncbi:MAG: ABC transporter permease [Oscillospiraceae bacterium]|nr:ABC transporter permease [Oscillospiraceae bacterium]